MTREPPGEIPMSMLNALEYCPRRFYYEFVEGDMLTNAFVLEGSLQHERVDQPGEREDDEGNTQFRRIYLVSETLHLVGIADLVEERAGQLTPVEYKHGREGKWINDHIQLCAQALCLEERMGGQTIPFGFIFYFGSRRRMQVDFTPELRAKTLAVIQQARQIAVAATPPDPLEGALMARCKDCSIQPICLPEEITALRRKKGTSLANIISD